MQAFLPHSRYHQLSQLTLLYLQGQIPCTRSTIHFIVCRLNTAVSVIRLPLLDKA